ncbi:MAG TPA: CBS domain-containing protein, partial [Pyrodictium sp.]|nr:CBS domain-containing protein [Pyrodictium sp.]
LGGTGGIFSPMVAIGVMFGYGLSFLIGLKDLSDIEALMAAMVAGLFAGTNKVVVSAILFSLEVVGFGGLVPSALAASIAYLLTINAGLIDSQLSYRSSAKVAALLEIYERLKEERSLILEIPAEKVANKQVVTLYYRMTIADALKEIEDNLHIAYPVVDDHNRLIGYVEVEDLLAMEPNNRVYETLRPAPTTLPNTPLSTIIEYFARYGLERLFIIDYDGKLIGIVSKTDLLKLLLKAYTKEIVEGSVRGPPLHRKSASD